MHCISSHDGHSMAILAVTVAVALLAWTNLCRAQRTADVIVIGGGISGLAAAQDLANKKYSVILVEARDRTGGRIVSQALKGGLGPVELGAGWIQGITNNPVKQLADQYKLKTVVSPKDPYTLYGPNGAVSSDAIDAAEQQYANFVQSVAALAAKGAAPSVSIADAASAFAKDQGLDAAGKANLQALISSNMEIEFAASAADLSAVGTRRDSASGTSGDDVIITTGYSQLIAALEGAARNAGVQIVLGAPVTNIKYSATGVMVTTAKGSYSARAAVVTLPLGVLKRDAGKLFTPPLPADKMAAINRMGMGLLDKVALTFDKAFWADTPWLNNIPGTSGTKWSNWFNMHKVLGVPVIIALNAGSDAQELSKLSDEQIAGQAIAALRKMYGADTVPEPEEVLRTRWAAEPYTLGSYSYIRVGSTWDGHAALAKPVGNTLFFAGEATSSENPATTHGAYQSGIDAAAALNDAML